MAVLDTPTKWGVLFGMSTLLWVCPITLKAPKAIQGLSLVASLVGMGYATKTALEWSEEDRENQQRLVAAREIASHLLANQTTAEMLEITNLYFPVELPETIETMGISRNASGNETAETVDEPLRQQIATLKSQGLNQSEIIQTLWGAKPGGSKAYRDALAEYKRLVGEA